MSQAPESGKKVFLLSPASTAGKRAALLFDERARFPLARRLHDGDEVPIGEIFSFLSGLYFRGKLAYAERFALSGLSGEDVWVITSNRGLVLPSLPITLDELSTFAKTPIDLGDARYREPMDRDVTSLASRLGPSDSAVLLGSIATGKYVDLLLPHLGDRLVFPSGFAGLGDMSRGAIMLQSVRSGVELNYVRIRDAERSFAKRGTKTISRERNER